MESQQANFMYIEPNSHFYDKLDMIELNLIHDGTTVWLAQYGEVYTSSSLGTFDANISGGNVQLLFTPTNSTTTVKLMRTNIVV